MPDERSAAMASYRTANFAQDDAPIKRFPFTFRRAGRQGVLNARPGTVIEILIGGMSGEKRIIGAEKKGGRVGSGSRSVLSNGKSRPFASNRKDVSSK